MKNIRTFFTVLFISMVLIFNSHSSIADKNDDLRQEWILSQLNDKYNSGDYIFYCMGHRGISWSMVTRDSTKIYFFHTSTLALSENTEYLPIDTLKFVDDNIKTITWGLDSLAEKARLLTPPIDSGYMSGSAELFIVKNNELVFNRVGSMNFTGNDSGIFNYKLRKLIYLMLWLMEPSLLQNLPAPNDSLIIIEKTENEIGPGN